MDKVDGGIYIKIEVYVPPSVRGDNNVTLMLDVNKRTMKEVSDNDKMYISAGDISADLTHWSKNITAPDRFYDIVLNRKVSADDITNMKLEMMPGFRFSWNYNTKIKPLDKYSNFATTKEFVR